MIEQNKTVLFTGVPTRIVDLLVESTEIAMGYETWTEETGPETFNVCVDKSRLIPGWERALLRKKNERLSGIQI